MACHVAVHAAVVLNSKNVLRTVLLIYRPVVDELIEQLVFARVDNLLGIADGLLVVGLLVPLPFYVLVCAHSKYTFESRAEAANDEALLSRVE